MARNLSFEQVRGVITKYGIELTMILLVGCFLWNHNSSTDMQHKIIKGDGEGYYAYLPAIFIYADLDYGFKDDYQSRHYGFANAQKNFLAELDNGEVVNKYFPGVAFLWLPFFLLAHVLAMLFGLEADGYSHIYQLSVAIANLFYLWMAGYLIRSILKKLGHGSYVATVVPISLILGTNVFYYSVYDSSLTHITNFFLFALIGYAVIQFSHTAKRRYLATASAAFGLLCICRPQDLIVLAAIPAFIGDHASTWRTIRSMFKGVVHILAAILPAIVFLVLLGFLWKLQAGTMVVDSYGEESFDFTNPRFGDALFSYRKGWLLYTPLVMLALIGLYRGWKENHYQIYSITLFLGLAVFTTSSWWCWYYGMSFGQRALIDFYPILAIPLAVVMSGKRKVFTGLLVGVCVVFNLWRGYQHQHGILPSDEVTKDVYWSTMFSTEMYSEPVFDPALWEVVLTDFEDFETDDSSTNLEYFNGTHSGLMNEGKEFSVALVHDLDPVDRERKILIDAHVLSQEPDEQTLVVSSQRGGEVLSYDAFKLSELDTGKWAELSKLVDIPEEACELKVYVWSPNKKGETYIDDLSLNILVLRN